MKLSVIDAGNFKLDGGAMFGVVPKVLWSKQIPADDLNLCSWKMRCLLIEDGERLILIDTGMGNKQSEKWLGYYYRHGEGDLIKNIRAQGYHEKQITDVILSHLHFDHAGGAVSWNSDKTGYIPTFSNAKYWTHSEHWDWAMNPNEREKATFLTENLLPLQEHGQLNFVDKTYSPFGKSIAILTADGHTEKMLMPVINTGKQKLIFIADTIPSHAHVHVPYCMGYDVRPLVTMTEKKDLLNTIIKEDWLVFYDHDPFYDISKIEETAKGFRAKDGGQLSNYFA